MRLASVVGAVFAVGLTFPAAAQGFTIAFYIAKADNGGTHPDAELARWALDAWSKASDGAFDFVETEIENDAFIRIYWVGPDSRRYGEMRVIEVDGRRGAEIFVNTATIGLGEDVDKRARTDRLYRDTVVYLTCVHELGHAVGLSHTNKFDDIMYSFQHGGDIERYFLRFRKRVKNREQIREHSPFSDNDLARLHALY